MSTVYTIPPEAPFVDSLAEGLWRDVAGDALKLSEYLVLLPTRRACLHLREAFLRRMDKNAALLPRMQPLGEIDEEELYFTTDINPNIPPAIAPLRRQLLLTQLVMKKDANLTFDQAAQLAMALAQFLDQVQIFRCDTSKLPSLVEEQDLAEHWKRTVKFLEILTEHWPVMLAQEGCIDPVERRVRVMEAQCVAWRANPPAFPIIAAGSTGTQPATAELLSVIASLPKGVVILPGLDGDLDETAWQAIGEKADPANPLLESHPQAAMKELLKKLGIAKKDVRVWCEHPGTQKTRVRLLQESQRPSEVTGAWEYLRKTEITNEALKNLSSVTLDHPQEEAQAIALIMRQTLETPGKTAALVTPDRGLAERVSSMLSRWDIKANDSAGAPLSSKPAGGFLLDVLAAASPMADAVDYLTLLKHPTAACGLNPVECRARAREIEITVWRRERSEKSEWLQQLREMFMPITATWKKKLSLADRIAAHVDLALRIATSDTEEGKDRLWKNEDGEAASEWFEDWRDSARGFPPVTGEEYEGLCAELMRGVTVRAAYGQHPRLAILGLLEARLIHADVTILGGLNEGIWPPEPAIDPWMSRPMKRKFGLPMPEQRIGLAAHDFVQLASSPEVVLTRARRSGNAPTVPSRFLLQLETALRALGFASEALAPKEPWNIWARMLDDPEKQPQPCVRPEPKPPQNVRPKTLSVTEIGTWQRNPYAIYAKHILKLVKLDPLEATADAADRGTVIHKALDDFVKKYPKDLPENAQDDLLQIGRALFSAYDEHPEVKAFWWPRFEMIADWFVKFERVRRAEGIMPVLAEAKGKIALGDFTLKGRADRIDRLADGKLAVADYKTGSIPKKEDVLQGYEPQLPLLALIAERGGFEELQASQVADIAYWCLGGRTIEKPQNYNKDIENLIAAAGQGLEKLIKAFANPATPYQAIPKPRLRPRYDDYAHLARLAEWGRTLEEG